MRINYIVFCFNQINQETGQLAEENPLDENLIQIIQSAKSQILPNESFNHHVCVLADIIQENLGGPIAKSRISQCGYEIEIVDLKRARNSNIIPLGSIKTGLYRERALMFKLLADICGVPTTLGEFLTKNKQNSVSY